MNVSQKSRTYNSIFNSIVGIFSAVLNVVLNFFVRIVIVRTLGEEINGLHSLFQNIINILAVVETSICTAMIIHLYEPIKNDNIYELSKILTLYDKIYKKLAIVFIVFGAIVNIFLEGFITTAIPMSSAHLYFFLFTLTMSASYFTYTYRVVLFASQKNRISSIATLVAEIIFRGGAAVTAMIFQNYTIFLLCFIGEKIFGNLICCLYVRKTYRGISCQLKNVDNSHLQTKIFATVKPLFISRIADIVQNSSQSILISLLLGNIAIVGYYGNYALVIGSVGLLFSQFGAAFTTSFGNLATENDCSKMYNAFRKAEFILIFIATVICSGFISCIQDFIALAFGPQFLLGNLVVVILTFTMFITLLNIPGISVQNATGCHDMDVNNMIIQALCSVIGGYIGGSYFGMEGLLMGMLIPLILFTTIVKNIIVQKNKFKKRGLQVLCHLGITLIRSLFIVSVVVICTIFINTNSLLLNIFIKGILSVIISVALLVMLSFKNPYFKNTINIFMPVILSVFKKIKS